MRIRYPDEFWELWHEVEPYLDISKLEVKLKPGTPKEIKDKYEQMDKIAEKYDEEARKFLMER